MTHERPKDTRQVRVDLPIGLDDALRIKAARERTSKAALIRLAIATWFETDNDDENEREEK